jgi:DNA repair exonuclease SbcCD ATPase subunit
MSEVTIKLANVGGLEKFEASVDLGAVSVIRGAAASGKSSILRGALLALVGTTYNSGNALKTEAESLRIHDTGEDGLLRDIADSADASVKVGEREWRTKLGRSTGVKSSGGEPKALYTSLLARLPPTRLYNSIYSPSEEERNNFRWITDDLSDAGTYSLWLNVLDPLSNQMDSLKLRAEQWRDKQSEISDQLDILEAQKNEKQDTDDSLGEEQDADLGQKKADRKSAREKRDSAKADYQTAYAKLTEWERENKSTADLIVRHEKRIKTARREIGRLDELANTRITRPDLDSLRKEKEVVDDRIAARRGASEATSGDAEGVQHWDEWDPQNPHAGFAAWMETKRTAIAAAESGDEDQSESNRLGAEITRLDRDYREKMSQRARAEEDLGVQRRIENEATNSVRDLETQISGSPKRGADLRKKTSIAEAEDNSNQSAFEELDNKIKQMEQVSPEQKALRTEITELETKISTLRNSQEPFLRLRLDALGMTASEEQTLTENEIFDRLGKYEAAEGDGEAAVKILAKPGMARNDVQSHLYEMFEDGTLWALTSSMKEYCRKMYEEHRQAARRIFNETGSSLFEALDFSPFEKVELDTDYQLRMKRKGQDAWIGISGSEGERVIVAASLLIAMRKAYTPGIPLLMFDGVLDNLDDAPKAQLMNFLREYASNEGIAIVVTSMDTNTSVAQVHPL